MTCDGEGCGLRTRAMSVYGKRCLGFIKENCWGTMRLEVSIALLILVSRLTNDTPYSTRMQNCTISSCITVVCLTLKRF